MTLVLSRYKRWQKSKTRRIVSIAFIGVLIEVWERILTKKIFLFAGARLWTSNFTFHEILGQAAYYPVGLSFERNRKRTYVSNHRNFSKPMFKKAFGKTKGRPSINQHTAKGTYFFDYGKMPFCWNLQDAGADVF